jgi:hypothetical protein
MLPCEASLALEFIEPSISLITLYVWMVLKTPEHFIITMFFLDVFLV